jgi:CheY-like chemotaxis protein
MKRASTAAKNGTLSRSPQKHELGGEEKGFRQRLNEKLRTRLNAIIGFSELLALEPSSANAKSDLKQVLKAARELLTIVDQELTDPSDPARLSQDDVGAERAKTCDILYIEDDIANFILVERILELRPSLALKHANTGQSGVEAALLEKPKLILLDLNLPDIHGADVLQLLQSTPETSQIPVVVLSANVIPSQIERLLAAGARNYLTKPFDIDPFLAVVDELAG